MKATRSRGRGLPEIIVFPIECQTECGFSQDVGALAQSALG